MSNDQQIPSQHPTDLYWAERMRSLNRGDIEGDHMDADDLLCVILTANGFTDTVKAYQSISKRYA